MFARRACRNQNFHANIIHASKTRINLNPPLFPFIHSGKSIILNDMSETPPKHAPDNANYEPGEGGGQLVAMYNAASHANAESFPVLKAFQDYIEAERSAARKRVMQLSIFFAVLMGVVVTGFLTAGIFMLRNMSAVQNKLLDVALSERAAPPPAPAPVVQTSPLIEESVRQISRATSDLQSDVDKKIEGVSEIAAKMRDRVASQDNEMRKLRESLKKMQEQSALLRQEIADAKAEREKKAAAAKEIAQAKASAPPAAPAVPAAPAATAAPAVPAAPAAPAATASAPQPAPKPATAPEPARIVARAEKPKQPDPRFPPAVKDPPLTPDGITPPDAPSGMIATVIPLKTKRSGTIPWRVLMPE